MKYIFANWKMYLNFDESMILTNQLLQEPFDYGKINLGLFPTTLAVSEVIKAVQNTKISVGAQNVNWTPKGAYTGAISALFFKDIGCQYSLVGHSERRHIFGETNDDVRKKIEACLDSGLIPVLCVGETQEDRDNNKAKYRIKKQLSKALDGLEIGLSNFFIAYEPVWSIGTGNFCDPEDVASTHNFIFDELKEYTNKKIPLLYGGSVNDSNVVSYLSFDCVDGVLVGGASAKFDLFVSLIKSASSYLRER